MLEFSTTHKALGNDAHTEGLEQLMSFCRGEMSAVETYQRAIVSTKQDWLLKRLRKNLASHERRVLLLKLRIAELGGTPPESSGPWGAFANAVEGVAAAISESAALSILEEGERHGVLVYQRDFFNLDDISQRLIAEHAISQQIETRNTVKVLRRALAA